MPQVTFTDRMVIELGGTAVELSHVGRNHSDNSIVMRFPKERILFAVDFIPVKSVGFRDWPDAYIEDWIESLRRVESMDFDVLVPGHGPVGTKDDVRAFRVYMEELRDEVTRLAREGKSEQEVVQAVQLTKYESWGGYKDMVRPQRGRHVPPRPVAPPPELTRASRRPASPSGGGAARTSNTPCAGSSRFPGSTTRPSRSPSAQGSSAGGSGSAPGPRGACSTSAAAPGATCRCSPRAR